MHCRVSEPSAYSGAYTMEVINQNSSASYSGSHTFSQSAFQYQSITPVAVSSGDVILVRRSLPVTANIADQGGDSFQFNAGNIPFPITSGNLEFLSCNAVGGGGPVTDFAMPNIGLGFQLN